MIRYSQCPSCGAKVHFRASSTQIAVCEYCQSTLIRTDIDVENIGKMADLLPDTSLLQIGSQGSYKHQAFSVIGRVQYQHSSGIWNEWHLLFSNGDTGWLSEASGSFVLSFLKENQAPNLPKDEYKLDLTIPILGQRLTVTNIEDARCIAGQGELPFKIHAGFDVTVVDLSNEALFASIDFSVSPPLLFVGEMVELSSLALENLRDIEHSKIKASVRSFNCPNCASPVSVTLSSTHSIVCKTCTAIIDTSNKNVELIVKSQKAIRSQINPVIELGSIGHFDGVNYTVIGYIRRSTRSYGVNYFWSEFLLHHPGYGFKWLISSNGHWTYAKPLQKHPSENQSYSGHKTAYFQKNYKHFAKYEANVVQVLGEFYWKVKLDDKAVLDDFINPPSVLTKEKTSNEVSWTVGEYLTKEEVERAFGNSFELPNSIGVSLNQPSPYDEQQNSWLVSCVVLIILAIGLQLFFTLTAQHGLLLETSTRFQKVALRSTLVFDELPLHSDNTTYQSPEFEVKGRPSNLVIQQSVGLNNSWMETAVTLVEKNTGRVFYAEREAGYYSGYDSDGSWTEDNSQQEVIFSRVPTGVYLLQIDADSDWSDGSKPPIPDLIRVYRDVPQWSNFWILLIFLCLGPAIFYYMRYRFEVKRWEESDHPLVESE